MPLKAAVTQILDNAFDIDGDGLADSIAGSPMQAAALRALDTDKDGVPNIFDLDSDNDGLPDTLEADDSNLDSNWDGRLDGFVDSNGDGLDDAIILLPIIPEDTDNDGIPDHLDTDTDNDGLWDAIEVRGDGRF